MVEGVESSEWWKVWVITELIIFLHQNGFHRRKSEPTLYLKMQEIEDMLIVCIYVDDIIYTGSSKKLIEILRNL